MEINQTRDSWKVKFKTPKYQKSKDLSFNTLIREQAKRQELNKLKELDPNQVLPLWTQTTTYGPYVETIMSSYDYSLTPKRKHDNDCPKSPNYLKRKIKRQYALIKKTSDYYEKLALEYEAEQLLEMKIDAEQNMKCNCVAPRGTSGLKSKCNLVKTQKHFNQKGIHNFINSKVVSFQTLTFKQNIKDIDEANVIFKKYMRALERRLKAQGKWIGTKYVVVYEYQQRGAVHYHLLWNIPLDISANKLWVEIAGNGTLLQAQDLKVIYGKGNAKENIIKYFSKYLSKDFEKLTSTRIGNVNRKSYRFSKSCTNPKVETSTTFFRVKDILSQVENGSWSSFVIDMNKGKNSIGEQMSSLWYKNVIDTRTCSNGHILPKLYSQRELSKYLN